MVRSQNPFRIGLMSAAAVLALVAGAGPATPSWAQSKTAAAVPDDQVLGELVVTAERRSENLQKVPIAATVLNAEQLEAEGVNRVADLQAIAPSVAISTYNRSTFINIRGVGIAQSAPTSTPGVAYYIDGAFLPHETNIGNTFYDIDSVEVLRGPQGTLTGQNSTGGAVYARTAEPKFDAVSGYVDQTVGDYAWYRTVGAVNIPLSSTLAVRLAAVHEERDSFSFNKGGPNQPGNVDFTGYRANLEWKPNDKFQANIRYENDNNDNNGNAYKNRNDFIAPPAANPTGNYDPRPFVINEDAAGYFHQKGYRSDAEFKYLLIPQLQLRYLFSYQYGNVTDLVDGDRSLNATTVAKPYNGRLGYTSTTNNIRINEVDAISQGDGPFQYVIGGFFLDERVPVTLITYADTVSPAHPGAPTVALSLNRSRSVFGQATYQFTPQWQAVLGIRESWDTQTYTRFSGLPPAPAGPASYPYTSEFKSDQPTGRAALNFQATDNTLFYGAFSRGYKAGGVNLLPGNAAAGLPANFDPETNSVEELGVKTDFYQHHLRVNADVFDSQYDGLQLSSLNAATHLPFTANVPKSKSWGAELEATVRFNGLAFNAGLAYLDAKTSSSVILVDNTADPSAPGTVPSGTRLPFSPTFTANAGLQYDIYFGGDQRLTPRIQINSVSDSYAVIFHGANALAPAASLIPEHTTVDLRLSYAPTKPLQIEAFATNIFDKTYVAAQVQDSSSANGGYIYGAPRQVGIRLLYKYH
jgi:iron complex outermembrane receptor protein